MLTIVILIFLFVELNLTLFFVDFFVQLNYNKVWVDLGQIQGRFRVDLGQIQGRFRVDLGQIQGRFRVDFLHSFSCTQKGTQKDSKFCDKSIQSFFGANKSHSFLCSFFWLFAPKKRLGRFRVDLGQIQGRFRVDLGQIQGRFRKSVGDSLPSRKKCR